MKVYEALKEMIENGKTITGNGYSYKMGKVGWQKKPILIKNWKKENNWKLSLGLLIEEEELTGEWKVIDEAKGE